MLDYRRVIESKKAEVERYLSTWDDIAVERAPDALDEGRMADDRDLAIATKDRFTELLRQLRAALQRLSDGTFGSCMNCGAPLGATRLQAVPWAALCRACQEAADRERQRRPEAAEGGFSQKIDEAA